MFCPSLVSSFQGNKVLNSKRARPSTQAAQCSKSLPTLPNPSPPPPLTPYTLTPTTTERLPSDRLTHTTKANECECMREPKSKRNAEHERTFRSGVHANEVGFLWRRAILVTLWALDDRHMWGVCCAGRTQQHSNSSGGEPARSSSSSSILC